jgi:hypothetical protein
LAALQIVHAPIHLASEPHLDDMDFRATSGTPWTPPVVAEEDHDGNGHHERHSATLHKLKLTQPSRVVMGELPVSLPAKCPEAPKGLIEPQRFAFTGLSPPELLRCWQFMSRAALPVRAPSLLS